MTVSRNGRVVKAFLAEPGARLGAFAKEAEKLRDFYEGEFIVIVNSCVIEVEEGDSASDIMDKYNAQLAKRGTP